MVQLVDSFTVHETPNVIETISPKECDNTHILLIGSYQYEAESKRRTGSVTFCTVEGEKINLCERFSTVYGILDLKIINQEATFLTANSSNSFSAFSLNINENCDGAGGISLIANSQGNENDGVCFSVDYSASNKRVLTGNSKGNVDVVEFERIGCGRESDKSSIVHHINAHDLEVWNCSFDNINSSLIYTCSDDATVKIWDLRTDLAHPISTLGHHMQGVCSISMAPIGGSFNEEEFATGSYDDTLRLWDKRNLSLPINSLNAGDGVWRIRWCEKIRSLALACMYGGFKIVDLKDFTVSHAFNEPHSSIGYGISWMQARNEDISAFYLSTCSFYDKKVCLWRF